jgi:hypothetical protein
MTGNAQEIITFLFDADKKQIWDIEPHKEKRRLTQNAYYWVLLEKLAVKTHVSKAEIHNTNLRALGLVERMGDKPIYIMLEDTEKVEKQTLLAETYHLAPTRQAKTGTDNKTYRWYVMLRGSSSMNVEEMSALVDLAVQDAKEQGIETLTPNELEHIRELERNNEKKHNKRP